MNYVAYVFLIAIKLYTSFFGKQTSEAPFYTGSLPCQGVQLFFATLQISISIYRYIYINKIKWYPVSTSIELFLTLILLFL